MTAVPGQHLKTAIRDEVAARLVVFARGRAHAITGERLAEFVRDRLAERDLGQGLQPKTLQRRCQEAIAELIEMGEEIASSSTPPCGYFIPQTREEYRDGERMLVAHLISSAKRFRTYNRRTADAVLRLLGQGPLALSKSARARRAPPVKPTQEQLALLAGGAM